MSKKGKKGKKPERRFEATVGQSLKSGWAEVAVDGVTGAGLGAGAGVMINQLADVGSLGLNAGIGAAGGLVVGAAGGLAIVYQRECRLVDMANEVLEEVEDTMEHIQAQETLSDVVREAFAVGLEFMKSRSKDEDEEDDEAPKQRKQRKGQRQQQQPNA